MGSNIFLEFWVTRKKLCLHKDVKQIYRCQFCGHDDFASAKGLNQHQCQKQACFTKLRQKYVVDNGYRTAQETIQLEYLCALFEIARYDVATVT